MFRHNTTNSIQMPGDAIWISSFGSLVCAVVIMSFIQSTEAAPIDEAIAAFEENIISSTRRAQTVVIAIDNSTSVKEAGILPRLKDFAIGFLHSAVGQRPIVSILAFNSQVEYISHPAKLDRESLSSFVSDIERIDDTGGLTWTSGVIDAACAITSDYEGEHALLMASDGKPSTTDGLSQASPPELASVRAIERAEYFKENCSIIAVIGIVKDGAAAEFFEDIASEGAVWTTPLNDNLVDISSAINAAFRKDDPGYRNEQILVGIRQRVEVGSLRNYLKDLQICALGRFRDPEALSARFAELGAAGVQYNEKAFSGVGDPARDVQVLEDAIASGCEAIVTQGGQRWAGVQRLLTIYEAEFLD